MRKIGVLAGFIAVIASGCGPAHMAALKGETDRVLALAPTAGDLDRCGRCASNLSPCGAYSTPLGCAACGGQIQTMKALLARGALVGGIDMSVHCRQPLYMAAFGRNPSTAKFLLDHGADPDSALWMAAVWNKDYETTRILLEAGADVNMIYGRKTILELARGKGGDIAKLFESAAADKGRMARAKNRRGRGATGSKSGPSKAGAVEKTGDEAVSAGRAREAIGRYSEALRDAEPGSDSSDRLKGKILKLARSMNPAPGVPDEARRRSERAQAFLSMAQDEAGFAKGVEEMREAVTLAPWWPDAYYNLGLLQEKSKDYAGAIASLKFYLEAAPRAPDAEAVRKKIVHLEVAQELGGKAQ